ncbi:MAG: glycosyltransferase family 4 protein [Lentisphaerae bacterium]|nr:glycosyltransferase family 4 protein [Lentisphaerota bacterium]
MGEAGKNGAPLRIALVLRGIEERQGTGVYTRNLTDELLAMDRKNEYVLFYSNPDLLGHYSQYDNVTERVLRAPGKLLWDQIAVPLAAAQEGVDLIFHPKFTVPLLSRRPTVMTIHGSTWFVHPELYTRAAIAYIKLFMPLYCRKARYIISNSDLTSGDFIRLVNVPPAKVQTIHLGCNKEFHAITDRVHLEDVRRRYALPEKFILAVSRYDPRKNFKNMIAAFRALRQRIPCKLVVTGLRCEKYREEYALDADGTADDVQFLGWIEHDDLPAIYNLAHCMFFPSVYEEFGIPSCEAMACGCPPVISKTGALPEIAADAGVLVDPFDPDDMATALERIWTDDAFRAEHARRSLERAKAFTWRGCAEKTLKVFEGVMSGALPPHD